MIASIFWKCCCNFHCPKGIAYCQYTSILLQKNIRRYRKVNWSRSNHISNQTESLINYSETVEVTLNYFFFKFQAYISSLISFVSKCMPFIIANFCQSWLYRYSYFTFQIKQCDCKLLRAQICSLLFCAMNEHGVCEYNWKYVQT